MFAELCATSNFTFLTGASHPEEYMRRAALIGLPALAVADENSVAGIVRAHSAARAIAEEVAARDAAEAADGPIGPPCPPGISRPPSVDIRNVPRLIPAARLVFREGVTLTALPEDRTGWAHLCRIVSAGRLRTEKGSCDIGLDDLWPRTAGLQFLLNAPRGRAAALGCRLPANWRNA
jgi:DNA polymerase III, alpha subunit